MGASRKCSKTYAKQKHLGCKIVQDQSEVARKQAGVTKALISAEVKKLLYQKYFLPLAIVYSIFSQLTLSPGHLFVSTLL